jgi:predicted N-acyltransferase
MSKSGIGEEGVGISIHTNIREIAGDWDTIGSDNVFLHSEYLQTIENFPPKGLKPYYLLIRDGVGKLIGKVYLQSKKFKAQESLTISRKTDCPSFFSTLGFYLKEHVARKVEFRSIACGNLMVSGEHGFKFISEIDSAQQHLMVDLAIKRLIDELATQGEDISIVLLKDFSDSNVFNQNTGFGPELYSFKVQPNMVLKVRDHWKKFEDYLGDMSSKYRVRYKRARKKLDGIEIRPIRNEELEFLKERMFELYKNIANTAGFNLFILSPDYIPELARRLGEKVRITGYFKEGELVGYTTLIANGGELEAHFLGFDSTVNTECQLYLNMLYEMARTAIEQGFRSLNYSRTALEIKSSVGAVPVALNLYIRHQKSVQNKFLPKLFDFLSPVEEWVQRHPFKASV